MILVTKKADLRILDRLMISGWSRNGLKLNAKKVRGTSKRATKHPTHSAPERTTHQNIQHAKTYSIVKALRHIKALRSVRRRTTQNTRIEITPPAKEQQLAFYETVRQASKLQQKNQCQRLYRSSYGRLQLGSLNPPQ